MSIKGLTDAQVRESAQKHGTNTISQVEREGFWDKLKDNFGDPMIKILCVALIINVVFVFMGEGHWYEAAGIALAVVLATFISTYSEFRNENAFQKLQDQASKIRCKVYRNGSIVELAIDDIVVGDYVVLQPGDKIPADGVMAHGEIMVDQSLLNGEAKEARKCVPTSDYIEPAGLDFLDLYKVFRGTVVCEKNGVMRVTKVGDATVYGQIASELQTDDDRDTPLKVKLSKLANDISKFGYIGGTAIAVAFVLQRIVIHNHFDMAQIAAYCSNWMQVVNDLVQAIMLAVIIIVMAVPEGLPLMIAIVSALNMGKMLNDNVLVRKIAGIETAGSLNLLFSDKTGTITKGLLEAILFIDGAGTEYKSIQEVKGNLSTMLSLSIYNNTDAVITDDAIIGGNSTERAVLGFGGGKNKTAGVSSVASLPFNSANKYSATQIKGSHNLTLIKGAPEMILDKCVNCYVDGEKKPFDRAAMEKRINEFAARAIRIIALATSDSSIKNDKLPTDSWTLVGIMCIRDELRPESVGAIKEVMDAGVQVVMITGDRKDTAVAIATEAGLLKDKDSVVWTSAELAKLSDKQVKANLKNLRVVARALPSDKSRLVRLAQELDLVVGMTGDGVNDSPALKKADVGFAMGGGTEVAKEASGIVIMDDNFLSIAKAVLYGRTIFNNIRKFIVFQLTINVSAVLVSFVAPLLDMENPLTIIQILWINLVMDTLAALAFGGEPVLKRYMKEKPKSRDENIVSKGMWSQILTCSTFVFILSMFMLRSPMLTSYFRVGSADNVNMYLLTGYFTFFVFAAVFNAFNARTDEINLFESMHKNKGFVEVLAIIVAIQMLLTTYGGEVVKCYSLTLSEWGTVLGLAVLVIPIDLIRKTIINVLK